MQSSIQTPLPPIQHKQGEPLTLWTTLGVVAEMSIVHGEACQRTVAQRTHRVLPALQSGQCHVFLDEEQRPWGYASWATVD
ncbi:toxin-activating lysine-acyltransferase, partial [Natronospirillum operosum]